MLTGQQRSVTLHSISRIAFFSTVLAIELQGTMFARKGLSHSPSPQIPLTKACKTFSLVPFPICSAGERTQDAVYGRRVLPQPPSSLLSSSSIILCPSPVFSVSGWLCSLAVAHGGVSVSSCSCGLTACTSTLDFLVLVWQFSYILETKKYVCST